MSNVTQCDICKKVYKEGMKTRRAGINMYNTKQELEGIGNDARSDITGLRTLDLCENCTNKLIEFIKTNRNNELQETKK